MGSYLFSFLFFPQSQSRHPVDLADSMATRAASFLSARSYYMCISESFTCILDIRCSIATCVCVRLCEQTRLCCSVRDRCSSLCTLTDQYMDGAFSDLLDRTPTTLSCSRVALWDFKLLKSALSASRLRGEQRAKVEKIDESQSGALANSQWKFAVANARRRKGNSRDRGQDRRG